MIKKYDIKEALKWLDDLEKENLETPENKEVKKILLEDIVIPAGTIFKEILFKKDKRSNHNFNCTVKFNNEYGYFSCYITDDKNNKYFNSIKQ